MQLPRAQHQVDEAGFEAAMEEQRRARESSGFGADYNAMIRVDGASEFKGYDHLELNGKVTALFIDGKAVDSVSAGQEAVVIRLTRPRSMRSPAASGR